MHNREFISGAEIREFTDDDWEYEEDLVFKESFNSSISTKFVKDTRETYRGKKSLFWAKVLAGWSPFTAF